MVVDRNLCVSQSRSPSCLYAALNPRASAWQEQRRDRRARCQAAHAVRPPSLAARCMAVITTARRSWACGSRPYDPALFSAGQASAAKRPASHSARMSSGAMCCPASWLAPISRSRPFRRHGDQPARRTCRSACSRLSSWGGQEVIMRTVDLLIALQPVLLGLLVLAVTPPGLGKTIAAVGLVYVPIMVRLTRADSASALWKRTSCRPRGRAAKAPFPSCGTRSCQCLAAYHTSSADCA